MGREGLWGMIGVDLIGQIRRAYFEQHRAIKEVCGVLSLRHFRLASWRSLSLGGGGRDSGVAHFDLLGPPGWCSGWWPHDGDVAPAATSFSRYCGSGPTLELGRGIVGRAVGAAFAVLIAEELFASGCRFLISVTSAGQIAPVQAPPYFIVIDRALRDEGTSYHYLPSSEYSEANAQLIRLAQEALTATGITFQVGATWTTDAPFRETQEAIEVALQAGIFAVEMEAAALYAFAKVRGRSVLCFAHVTNQMGRIEGDFEKGAADGAKESLRVISLAARRWRAEKDRP